MMIDEQQDCSLFCNVSLAHCNMATHSLVRNMSKVFAYNISFLCIIQVELRHQEELFITWLLLETMRCIYIISYLISADFC